MKRVLESILSELRVVKKQVPKCCEYALTYEGSKNLDINRSVSKVMTKIDKLEKPIKEMSANSSKVQFQYILEYYNMLLLFRIPKAWMNF